MKKCLIAISLFQFILLDIATAQVPINDDCDNAIMLCSGFTSSGTTTGATADCTGVGSEDGDCLLSGSWGGTGACFDLENSVWYTFRTNGLGGTVNIDFSNITCLPGSPGELQAAVFSYSTLCDASTYSLVSTCEGGSLGDFSIFAPALFPNTDYLIVVDGLSAAGLPSECDFDIEVSGALGFPITFANTEDVTCFGDSDGTASINYEASTGLEMYSWTPDVSSASSAAGLFAGDYSVAVTDPVGGCNATVNFTIENPSPLNPVIVSVTDENCGMLDGYIDMALSGGTGPFEYLWTPTGFTTQDLGVAAAGIYTFTVTDANGCSTTMNNILIDGIGVGSADALVTDVSCTGLNDGQVVIDYVGSTSIATYEWSPLVSNTSTAVNLPPGDYSVDINTGSGTVVVNLFEEEFEFGTFAWNLNTGIGANQWSVNNVFDGDDCESGGMTLATVPDIPDQPVGITGYPQSNYLHISATTPGVCDPPWPPANANYDPNELTNQYAEMLNSISTEGYANVSISFYWMGLGEASDFATIEYSIDDGVSWTPIGGPYNLIADQWILETISNPTFDNQPNLKFRFRWRNNATGGSNPAISIDQILLTGEISSPGVFCPATVSFTVEEPEPLAAAVVMVTDEDCGTANGGIEIDVNGGITPYSFIWSPVGLGTEDLTGIEAGLYSVLISDVNGCETTITDVLVNTTGSASATVDITDVDCFGAANGAATINFPIGSGAETYAWTPDVSTSNSATDLSPGEYTVIVDDPGVSVSSKTLFQTTFEMGYPEWTLNTGIGNNEWVVDNLYAGGSCTTFGFPVYDVPDVPNQPAPVAGSPQSNYLHVRATTNSSGCDLPWPPENANYDQSETTDQSAEMNIGVSTLGYSNVAFNFYWLAMGNADDFGMVEYSVDGGGSWAVAGGPFNANPAWIEETLTDPAWDSQPDLRFRFRWMNNDNTGVDPPFAVDQIRITADTSGFVESCTAELIFDIGEPDTLVINVDDIQAENCNLSDGAIDISIAGGMPPYTYAWLPDGDNTEDISGIPAGLYSVTVTDLNGCVSTLDGIAVAGIGGPDIEIDTLVDAHCGMDDGMIEISVTAGNPPYSYSWAPIGGITEDLSDIFAGTYDLVITDDIGCASVLAGVIIDDIPGPSIVLDSITDEICGSLDGEIDITITGGTGPLSIDWTPGGFISEDLTGVSADNYTVNVTDSVGCLTSLSDIIVGSVGGPTAAVTSVTSSNCGLSNGAVDITVSDGLSPYTFEWFPGGEITEDISDISSGLYSVLITDDNGCEFTLSDIDVNDEDGPAISIVDVVDESCDNSNGSIDIEISGGTTPYSISWSPIVSADEDLNDLDSGSYSVIVTDQNGCQDSVSGILVANTTTPVIDLVEIVDASCFGYTDGSIDISISLGTMPFNFSWSSGQTTEDINNVGAGAYEINVVDANLCETTVAYDVFEPDPIFVDAGADEFIIPESSVVLNASASDGTTILWMPPTGLSCLDCLSPVAAPEESILYYITATDDVGCFATDSVFVEVALPEFIIPNSFTPNNDGQNDVFRIPYPAGIDFIDFRVYNRWGELVFYTNNPSEGWDGTYKGIPQEMGTYIYMIQAERRGREVKANGNVTLMY